MRRDKYLNLRQALVEDFGSIRQGAREMGVSPSTFTRVIQGRQGFDTPKNRARIESAYRAARPGRDLSGIWDKPARITMEPTIENLITAARCAFCVEANRARKKRGRLLRDKAFAIARPGKNTLPFGRTPCPTAKGIAV